LKDITQNVKIINSEAAKVLEEAIIEAQEGQRFWNRWMTHTTEVAKSPSKTYITFLGTALLAKSVDDRVDALSIKKSSGPNGYSARSLGHGVLVPASVVHGFDLIAKGREPLNNQPFFSHDRVDQFDKFRGNIISHYEYFLSCLKEINTLKKEDAFLALVAFLKNRLLAAEKTKFIIPSDVIDSLNIKRVLEVTERFIFEEVEGGKRAQAFVAAALDLIFESVRTIRINDPSWRFPGDVQVISDEKPVLAAEVRAKKVSESEAIQFSRGCAEQGIQHAMIVALAQNGELLPRREIMKRVMSEYDILVTIVESVEEMLTYVLAWNNHIKTGLITDFPENMLNRLSELEVKEQTLNLWTDTWKKEDKVS